MSGIQMMLLGTGASSSNTIQISAGSVTSGTTTWDGYGTSTAITGAPSNFGTLLTTDKVTIFNGATLLDCYYLANTLFGTKLINLVMSGNQTSTTWASMTIDGTTFTKATMGGAGTYNSGSDYTSWTASISSDPFAAFPSNIVFA